MTLNKLTKRYSASLLNLAIEEGQLERVNQDIEIFYSNCCECSDLYKLLKSPIIKNPSLFFSSITSISNEKGPRSSVK